MLKTLSGWEFGLGGTQRFIQAILMSSRWHKKLNLLIEFSNSIFINFILKHIGVELAFKINYVTRFLLL